MSTADEIAKLHDLLARGAITPDEFERQKAKLLAEPAEHDWAINRLRLSNDDKWIAGVCGGTRQAVAEAALASGLGYHAGLLSLAALREAGVPGPGPDRWQSPELAVAEALVRSGSVVDAVE